MKTLFRILLVVSFSWLSVWLTSGLVWADPSKYPEFAALGQFPSVAPSFIHIDELVEDVLARKPVVIVDVRSPEEYASQHIKGAISIPLRDLAVNLELIPKKGLVTLY